MGLLLVRDSQPVGMSTGRTAAKIENPNLFSIGEGFGFFVFFGKQNEGSFPAAVCPKPYQKRRITKVTHEVRCKSLQVQHGHRLRGAADPLGYADLILNGDPEEYLKNAAGSHGLEI